MGAWGVGLFQNDIADDLKHIYIDKVKLGKSDEDAYCDTVRELRDYSEDEEDSIDFWLALASLMHDYGRLTQNVKEKALNIINSECDIDRWDDCDKCKRREILFALRDKLVSDQPERKKVAVSKRQVPKVNPNDIWCLKLVGDNPYYLLILVDSWIEYDCRVTDLGDECAVIYVKVSSHIPRSVEEVDLMQFFCTHYRFWKNIDSSDIRAVVTNAGFSTIRKRMTFVGNYSFKRPENSEMYSITAHSIWCNDTPSYSWSELERPILTILKGIPEAKTRVK